MSPGTVTIHLIAPVSNDTNEGNHHLTNDEVDRAATFRFPEDASRWKVFRSGLRQILGATLGIPPHAVPVIITEFGKPVLAAPFDALHFSLSHCDDLALVALSMDGPVGVDLEPASRASELSGCETTFCHPHEIAALPAETAARHHRLLEIWTAKEALLKALGTGFSHPPENVQLQAAASGFTATSEPPLHGIATQSILRLRHPLLTSHCAALSMSSSVNLLEIIPPGGSTTGDGSVIPLPLT